MPTGRPSLYNPELADRICERIAGGESAVQICTDDDMPGLRTVMRWAVENESFGIEYARAREAQAEVMDSKILEAAEDAKTDAQAARVRVEAFKWRASKLAPKRYGERIDVTTGGEAIAKDTTSLAVQVASLLRMGAERADAGPDESR